MSFNNIAFIRATHYTPQTYVWWFSSSFPAQSRHHCAPPSFISCLSHAGWCFRRSRLTMHLRQIPCAYRQGCDIWDIIWFSPIAFIDNHAARREGQNGAVYLFSLPGAARSTRLISHGISFSRIWRYMNICHAVTFIEFRRRYVPWRRADLEIKSFHADRVTEMMVFCWRPLSLSAVFIGHGFSYLKPFIAHWQSVSFMIILPQCLTAPIYI